MPGYDVNRFVGLSEKDKSDLICIVCNKVVKNPVISVCCNKKFCEDCINERFARSIDTCPYDNEPLTSFRASEDWNKKVIDRLGKLRIRCDFKDKGCPKVVDLDYLVKHKLCCRYNPENHSESDDSDD